MRRTTSRLLPWSVLALAGACASPPDEAVDDGPLLSLADDALDRCVRDALSLADDDPVGEHLGGLRTLGCDGRGIRDLEGLQGAADLESLGLWNNDVADLAPLASLERLSSLQLGANRITDLTPLGGLTRLERLGLADNAIDDVSPLAPLTSLRWLNLDHNQLTGAAAGELCSLDGLRWLTIEHNAIEDTAVLDCLDAEVYAWWQSAAEEATAPLGPAGTDPAGPVPAPALHPDGGVVPAASRLRLLAAAPEGLVLGVEAGGDVLAAVPQLPGHLARRGDTVTLRRDGVETAVGAIAGDEVTLCQGPFAETCSLEIGLKTGALAPAFADDARPVATLHLRLGDQPLEARLATREGDEAGQRNVQLLDHVLASPNQYDAGSCLFMATTGAMELLINRHLDPADIAYDGDTDLSERYLMNASDHVGAGEMAYVMTDLAYTYDVLGGALLSRDYPFTAGYLCATATGYELCPPWDDGAFLTCYYNWLDELPPGWEQALVETPDVERTILFLDPQLDSNSVWDVGLMDWDVVDRIKHELDTKNAPVVVIYNHYLYWHSNVIVGYDDDVESGCPMVESTLSYFEQQGATSYVNKIEGHMDDLGGCRDRGVFYVRDSIYDGGNDEPTYTYSELYGVEAPYSRRITELSYNWLVYLGNHAYSLHVQR